MSSEEINNVKYKLGQLLKEKKQDDFIVELGKNKELVNEEMDIKFGSNTKCFTYLQYCCWSGYTQAVKWLLENGADLTKTGKNSSATPYEMACMNGFFELLDLLLKYDQHSEKILLKCFVQTIKYVKTEASEKKDWLKCFHTILNIILKKIEEKKIDVDECADSLFHGLYCANTETIFEILKTGVSLTNVSNYNGGMMIELLASEILEKHLDNATNIPKISQEPDLDGTNKLLKTIDFDYTALSPTKIDKQNLESDAIFCISNTSKFQYLLIHPLVLCFLFMKWHKISSIFWLDMGMRYLQAMFLCGFVISIYESANILKNVFRILVCILCGCQIAYHCFVWYRYHIQPKFKNVKYYRLWLKRVFLPFAIFVGLCVFDVIYDEHGNVGKVFLSAIIIMQSLEIIFTVWIKWIYGQMFKVVFLRFCKLLLSYLILIIAFTISYYVIFTKKQSLDNRTAGQFFKDVAESFCKIFLLLIGDLSGSDVEKIPVPLNFVFLFFVFVFSIVFINVLNGLAVNDIGKLLETAEITTYKQTIQYIHSVETFLSVFNFSHLKIFGDERIIKVEINPGKDAKGIILTKNIVKNLNTFATRNKINFSILSCIVTSQDDKTFFQ